MRSLMNLASSPDTSGTTQRVRQTSFSLSILICGTQSMEANEYYRDTHVKGGIKDPVAE